MIYKKGNEIKGYTISGHANYDEYGKDIVCSAISVLGQTTLIALNQVCMIPEEDLNYILDNDGYLEVKLSNKIDKDMYEKAQIVLETFQVGIKSIEKSYSEHLTLKYREV